MIRYRVLEWLQPGQRPAPFGVAFRDREGAFLFVPDWRGVHPLPVEDLYHLGADHFPKAPYDFRWSPEVKDWDEGREEDFDPMEVLTAPRSEFVAVSPPENLSSLATGVAPAAAVMDLPSEGLAATPRRQPAEALAERPRYDLRIRAVIAIDLGTSYSGYAFAFPNPRRSASEAQIYSRRKWPDAPTKEYIKTLTSLLYSPEGKVIAWGFAARTRLAELRKQGRAEGYHLLEQFKPALHQGRGGPEGPLFSPDVKSPSGQPFPVVDLLTDYLGRLKDTALQQLQGGMTGLLDARRNVRWCLTVPAIWSDSDKQWVRVAAERAGLVPSGPEGKGRLCLVLEPEAAALYCQQRDAETGLSQLTPGTRFMIVDAGGGTIDITVHEVGPNHELREVVKGDGALWGSRDVDRAFLEDLKYRLGEKVVQRFTQEEPEAFLELMDEWERAKCGYRPEQRLMPLPIPAALRRLLERDFAPVLRRLRERQDGDDVNFRPDRETMERFFEPAVSGIVEEVSKRFEALEARAEQEREAGHPDGLLCDYLFLVGGFAESPLLQQRIRTAFGHRVRKVVVPEAPSHAVLSGAVSYGLDPAQIRARRSRLTYGCAYIADFDPRTDDPSKRVRQRETGKDRVRDRFYVFVRAGDEVSDKPVVQTFTPFQSDATSAVFALYATPRREVRYIDEEGVRQVGKVSVTVPNITRGLDREIELSMSFGGTEITVEARALPSGQPVTATVDFASTYLPEEVGD